MIDNIIIKMNHFARKHPNLSLIISIVSLITSIVVPLLR